MATACRELWGRAWEDWTGRSWLLRTIALVLAGPGLRFAMERRMTLHDLLVGALYGVTAALSWGLLTLIASLLRAPGKLLMERDQVIAKANTRIQELEAGHPRLSACLDDQQSALSLIISNDGAASARVWAKITIMGDTLRPQNNAYAAWKHEPSGKETVEIAAGDHKEILIGQTDSADPSYFLFYWFVFFIRGGEQGHTHPSAGLWFSAGSQTLAPEDPALEIRQRVSLKVFSDPASLSPAIQCSITLVGCDRWENLSGVSLCSHINADPAEKWQAFYSAASSMLIHYRSVKTLYGAGSLGQEDWSVFKGVTREALSFSNNLGEPHRTQAHALLRPLVEIEQSSLTSFSIADLDSWLQKTNHDVLIQRWSSPLPPAAPPETTASE